MDRYETLTKYLDFIDINNVGEYSVKEPTINEDGSTTLYMPSFIFTPELRNFTHDFYKLVNENDDLKEAANFYYSEDNNLDIKDLDNLNEYETFTLLFGAVRSEYWSEGSLAEYFEDGTITRLLNRLKQLDT